MRAALCLTFMLFAFAGCKNSGSDSSSSSTFPVGPELSGATLAGPLAGKHLYLVPGAVNPTGCWVDSEYWSGSELFFGITSFDYTSLTNSTLTQNSSCEPTPGFDPQNSPGVTGNFNIYRAVVQGGSWVLTNLPLNLNEITSLAAPKFDGDHMVFAKYEKSNGQANIYFSTRTGDNSYTTPVAFTWNSSTCNDDNPTIFNSGNQVIWTSTRTVADGSACSGTDLKTFWSSTFSGGAWGTPVPITGTPASATSTVDQAWVDTAETTMYWTAASADCTGSPEICIMMAGGSGTNWSTNPTQIATPLNILQWPTSSTDPFVSLIGQFTMSNGYAFAACGVTYYVGSSNTGGLTTLNGVAVNAGATSPGPPYYYYHTDIHACMIPL